MGGTQRFEVTLPGDARVISGDPSVLVIESADDDGFTVRGARGGSSLVRIVDDEDRLYERIQLPVAQVASIALRPETRTIASELQWAFFRGERQTTVVFALLGPGGERLIDEAARAGGGSSWDSAVLDHPIEGDELAAPIVMGSGTTRTARAPLVDRVDRWVRTGAASDLVRRPSMRVGSGRPSASWRCPPSARWRTRRSTERSGVTVGRHLRRLQVSGCRHAAERPV